MKQKFELAKEFPNYFQEVAQRIAASKTGTKAESIVQVEKLLSANLQAILNRLNLVYVDVKGQPATEHFFQKLVEKMQACLPEGANKENLEVYISGGVVRTLLAYIYKELHTTMQSREVNQDESNEKIKKAKELQRKSIGILKWLFPNSRKYHDQKTAKTKSQPTTPACVLSPSNPFS